MRLPRRTAHPVWGWLLAGLAVLAVLVACPEPTFAQKKQSVETLIKKGQGHFDEQEYEQSIQTLTAALMRPGIAAAEKVKVYQLLAYNYIVLRRDEEADAAVRGLLVLEPDYALPDTESPRFRDFFDTTREKWEEEGRPGYEEGVDEPAKPTVAIKHNAPAQVDAGMAVSLSGKIDDPGAAVDKVVLFYRSGSTEEFKQAKVKYAMRKFSVDIPGDAIEPPLVEYYIQAVDADGLPVAVRGDAELPLRIAVPDDASVVESPWLWVPVSLAVVAAIVIPIVIVSTQSTDSTVSVNVFEQ